MYLKIKKLIPVTTFLITSLASFTVLDLYYFSTHSPDFRTYFSYIEFFANNGNSTGHGHGLLYYYLVSVTTVLKSSFLTSATFNSLVSSSVILTNYLIYLLGLAGYFQILKKLSYSSDAIFLTFAGISFLPPVLEMIMYLKPEILAFALLPWIIFSLDNFIHTKKYYHLIASLLLLSLLLQTKGSIFGIVLLFLFMYYFEFIKNEFHLILKITPLFLILFFVLFLENYSVNKIHFLNHIPQDYSSYQNRASFSLIYHINKFDFWYFPIFNYHSNSFIGISLLDTFGDYFNLSFNNDKSYLFYDKVQFSNNSFIQKYLRQYLGIIMTLFFYLASLIYFLSKKKKRIVIVSPLIGMVILLINAFGFPKLNFDPTKGDTLKVHYYSFILCFSIILLLINALKRQGIFSYFLIITLIISSLFISGFPKMDNSNINFYLESKASFTNLCSFNKKVIKKSLDANCDKVENFCMHNINSEDIFEKLLLDKQVRHISIEDNIKVINNLGVEIQIKDSSDCLNKLSDSSNSLITQYSTLVNAPIVNLLYSITAMFLIIYSIFKKNSNIL